MNIRSKAFAAQLTASLAIVAVTTAICFRLVHVNATTAALLYLLGILAIATAWGHTQSVISSVAAMLCFNYFFLPPIGRLTIADPQNWIALFAFLATALAGSRLSDRAKKQTREARSRQRETEQLYALSRSILLTESPSVGIEAAKHIADIFKCSAVALYNTATGEIFRGGPEELSVVEGILKQVALQGSTHENRMDHVLYAAIALGGLPIGSLAMKGLELSDGALQALLNLVAIALERVRAGEAASRAEAARQSEEFKSTLLDAIAHEFKTPLTSIKAASTSILSDCIRLSPQFRELASIIDEETDRLSLLVTEAVRMSQIDAGTIRLDRQPLSVAELLNGVVTHFEPQTEGRAIQVRAASDLPRVSADRDVISLALRQLMDNSLKYSPPGSSIDILAEQKDGRLLIRFRDRGPGIPERERERIFDKFYRRQISKTGVPGTGMGLYIVREIVRVHGGKVWAEGDPGSGLDFCVSLPVHEDVPAALPARCGT